MVQKFPLLEVVQACHSLLIPIGISRTGYRAVGEQSAMPGAGDGSVGTSYMVFIMYPIRYL